MLLTRRTTTDLYIPYSDESDPPVEKHKKRRVGNSIINIFKKLVDEFEAEKPSSISIIHISKVHNVQHRRVYDLFNLYTSLGICETVERGRIRWIGIHALNAIIKKEYAEIEVNSLTKPIEQLFAMGPSPSLGRIAISFVCLFLYLGVDTLNLLFVASVLHDSRSDIRSLERRMYQSLSFLEIIGIVKHSIKTSEYKLEISRDEFIKYAMTEKQRAIACKDPYSIEGLLNTLDEPYLTTIQKERLKAFTQM